MARNIYRFIKVERHQTRKGIYCFAVGILTMIVLAALMILSFIRRGQLPAFTGVIGYISFAVAVLSFYYSFRLSEDDEVYGRMIHSSVYVTGLAVALHVVVFAVGCLTILFQQG